MVAPVVRKSVYSASLVHLDEGSWDTQKKPYNLPMYYERYRAHCVRFNVFGNHSGNTAQLALWAAGRTSGVQQAAYAKAYERLVEKLGDTASLGVTLAQYGEARDMLGKRGSQLLAFSKSLLKRSPLGVAASLGISARDAKAVMRTRHGASKKLSDLWLEFWFGWKPAVSDIYSAIEVFEKPLPVYPIKGRATVHRPLFRYQDDPNPPWGETINHVETSSCTIGCDLQITNPNVRLAQELGLINLAQIAVDVMPWSFVLGWFSNLNSWVSSLSDFAGLTVSNGYVARRTVLFAETNWVLYGPGLKGVGIYDTRHTVSSIPRPQFEFRFSQWKPTRAATAISLLCQQLPRS